MVALSVRSTTCMGLLASCALTGAAHGQAVDNFGSVTAYINDLCPKMAAQQGSLNAEQTQLFVQCRAVRNASDPAQKADVVRKVTSEELLAQDSAIRGMSQSQMAVVSARLDAMTHHGLGASGLAMGYRPVRLAANDAGPDDGVRSDVPTGSLSLDTERRLQAFGNVLTSFGDKDADGLEAGFKSRFWSLTGGADYRLSQQLTLGLALGYGHNVLTFRQSAGRLTSKTFTLAAFAYWQPTERLEASLLGGYSRIKFRGSRNVAYTLDYTLAGTPNQTSVNAVAQSDATSNQVEGTASVFYNLGQDGWTFGPAAQVSLSHLSIDAFAESGAGLNGLGFAFPKQSSDSLRFSLGADVSRAISNGAGVLTPYVRFRGTFEAADRVRSVRVFYGADPFAATGGSSGAVLRTAATDRTRFTLGAGISQQFASGASLGLDASALLGMRDVSQYDLLVAFRLPL